FGSYPRTFARDVAALAGLDVDLVWAPNAEVMYPHGFATRIVPEGPARAGLEDAFRPQFFSGVATIVAKLFAQCRPDVVIFGEKDFQQLRVVTRMARDLDLAVKVIGMPTVREPDGLALSSRNVYLSAEERAVAPTLYRVLLASAGKIAAGHPIAATLADGRARVAQRACGWCRRWTTRRPATPIRSRRSARCGTDRYASWWQPVSGRRG